MDRIHLVEPVGFGGELIGTHEVHRFRFSIDLQGLGMAPPGFGQTRVDNYIQNVKPVGFFAPGQTEVDRFGRPEAYNLTQYIRQVFAVTPSDGGVFGTFNLVDNRNKVIRAEAINAARYGAAVVKNNARIVTTPRFVDFSEFGQTLVAYAIRSIFPVGNDTSQWGSPLGMIVYNAARQLYPQGWKDGLFGRATFFANRQFTKTVGIDQSLFGLPMVAFAIRELKVFGIPGDLPFGLANVSNWQRPIAPPSLDMGSYGVPTLEIHFTIITAKSVLPPVNQVGDGGRVINNTPELHQQGRVQTEWGATKVHNQFETYAFQGWESVMFGRHVVKDRKQTVAVRGWASFAMVNKHQVRNVEPDPPSPQTIQPDGVVLSGYGQPKVSTNVIRPVGIKVDAYGRPSVVSMGLLPIGIPPPASDNGTQFGQAVLNNPPYIGPTGAINQLAWGLPDVGPRYIWAPRGYPYTTGYWSEQGQQMDQRIFGQDHPERPVFGRPTVTHFHRKLNASGTSFGGYGRPRLSLRIQYVRPGGSKFTKYGIPVLNGVAASRVTAST